MNWRKRRNALKTLLPGVQRSSRLAFGFGLGLGLLLMLLAATFAIFGPENNAVQRFFSNQELSLLHSEIETLRKETLLLKDDLSRAEELQKLDREERSKLTLLINNLEAENGRLKEDLAFFEGFIPGSIEGIVSLKRLQVLRDTIPDQYRYRALLIQGSQSPPVNLEVQLLIKILNKDKADVIVLPSTDNANDPQYQIRLTRFSRVAGVFTLPSGSKLQSVELRILDNGVIRASSTTKL